MFVNKSRRFKGFVKMRVKKSASDFTPIPDSLFGCVRLLLHREPYSEAEGVFEDVCFGKTCVLPPAFLHRRIVCYSSVVHDE